MKPLVIYHANCTDGFGAAFAAWMKFGGSAEYMPASYGDKQFSHPADIREMVDGREVYILDFSFPRVVMDQIMSDAAEVVWLDHHKTAFEMWDAAEWQNQPNGYLCTVYGNKHHIHLHPNKSGAMLAWEYFHPGATVPMMIQHIDDRDRWQFKLKGSKEFHAALQSYQPWSFEEWRTLLRETHTAYGGSSNYMIDFCNQGHAILRAQEIMVEQQAKQARKCGIKTVRMLGDDDDGHLYIGLALNTQNHISETGHVLANKSGTYGLLWYVGADGKVKCSLRSNGDYDVSAIAKTFGGGGHKNAAGFETDLDTLKGWLA